ncbi:hypothetical protein C0Q70_16277 [Pomacea canaliculata]|uniref:DNA primase large subunit n=1 Tax=Pomacea canaliculata TaxID=400727 RepID=A0A2T7NPD4_POMCA|nr:hypothetical protein C0Q70_16277 [Pomacea canaliculata]
MDFDRRRTATLRTKRIQQKVNGIDTNIFEHCVQLYTLPPTSTISLEEFEELAVERLKVLRAVETVGVRCSRGSQDYKTLLEKEIKNSKLKRSILKWRDNVSHFILRLAYCRSEELRRWFIQQEIDLFRFRFQQESAESRARFLEINNLGYKPIDTEEQKEVLVNLQDSEGKEALAIENVQHYKVPFTEALDLVRSRRVYVHHGFAYVPQDDLVSILLTLFRMQLSHSLAVSNLQSFASPGRRWEVITNVVSLSRRYIGQDYASKKPVGEITADMIDLLSKTSFPLCMQQLHSAFRSNHHLRHGGRMQYGLFLKGIGLSLEEAIRFWKSEFTKIMDGDKFDKQYSYSIRHYYGKEGRKADYTPYSCIKIITTNTPGVGDFHGCPFKHSDPDVLRQKLAGQGLKQEGVDQVMQFVKGGHYQVACARVFELIHGSLSGGLIDVEVSFQHPNQYFEESYKRLHKDKINSNTPQAPRAVQIVPPPSKDRQSDTVTNLKSNSQDVTAPAASTASDPHEEDDFDELDETVLLDEAE